MTKRFDIEIPKRDYLVIPFSIVINGKKTKLNEGDLIFMTVSEKDSNDNFENYIFQKSLNNGISFDEENDRYLIEINSDDTRNIETGKVLGYDITIYYEGNKPKQQIIGWFTIGKKYTLNEVN